MRNLLLLLAALPCAAVLSASAQTDDTLPGIDYVSAAGIVTLAVLMLMWYGARLMPLLMTAVTGRKSIRSITCRRLSTVPRPEQRY